MMQTGHNPDVLSCLANLSSDEVFTPPELANSLLDLLPDEIWSDPNIKILDPACKSGVFLREAASRLIDGLKENIPDLQERINHICETQLYGLPITRLTALMSRRTLYCSKTADGKYSIATSFKDGRGNIPDADRTHEWVDGRCAKCGALQSLYDRPGKESYAYPFIHADIKEVFHMPLKFDVIIGNPPYQISDGGNGASARPIYNEFVEKALLLKPRFLIMIIPSKWFSGGKGLDGFRKMMLEDRHIKRLVDYTNSADCFPGVDVAGGVCYFLRDSEYVGDCEFTNYLNGKENTDTRHLGSRSTLIRYPLAESIVRKVDEAADFRSMRNVVSARKPFGLDTAVVPSKGDLTLRYNKGSGPFPRERVSVGRDMIDKWKIALSYLTSEHAGQSAKDGTYRVFSTMELLPPGHVCTETYLTVGSYASKEEAERMFAHMRTKLVRFLVLLRAVTQHITRDCFEFAPLPAGGAADDAELYRKYGLSDEEISFIESMIRPMQ